MHTCKDAARAESWKGGQGYRMTHPPPMRSLLDANGHARLGVFETTPEQVSWRRADFRSPLGRRHGPLRRRLAYKQFEYFGIVAPDLFAGCALANMAGWAPRSCTCSFHPPSSWTRSAFAARSAWG